MPTLSSDTVPVFKLYGETRSWPTPDFLHCESIAERSQLHNWHIKAHRHADLLHLLHIETGEVVLDLEGHHSILRGPSLIVVPTMAIHGFHFEQKIRGHIITLAQPLVEHLIYILGHQGTALKYGGHYQLVDSPGTQSIALLVSQLANEYLRPAFNRDVVLHALIQALAVQVARRVEHQRSQHKIRRSIPSVSERGRSHLQRFQTLIESHYREQPTVDALAKQLGITPTHLNTLCRQLADCSALQLIHERLLLEAKRQLTYTNMTISEVSDSLGFSEPAYFTRFFKRLNNGLTPKVFRLRQNSTPNK